jgi:hypothetical protein
MASAPAQFRVMSACSNTSGGRFNGLTTNNVSVFMRSREPGWSRIWENGHAHTSNITVSGNQFVNQALGNNPATNLQRGFRVTSHSSATTTVTYSGNTVSGANIGFQWYTPSNFSTNQPIVVTGNTITNNATGVLVQSQGLATLNFNRIVGNTTGLNNVDGIVTAENNWWGCNGGPGTLGCDSVRHRRFQSVGRSARERVADLHRREALQPLPPT